MPDWTSRVAVWDHDPDQALALLGAEVVLTDGVPLVRPVLMAGYPSAFAADQRVVYLAEQRVLNLRIPCPFPRMTLRRPRRTTDDLLLDDPTPTEETS